ncbi:hypothetical protein [Pseudomonas syringae]|uniref:Phage-related protein n=3 Tax=Pseudomonas syringae TaxID=317 RepID=A0A3M4K4L6_PSESF|nr:hypothetical protein [Pseudomonas syringae]EPM46849.1 hypothetical protein A246_15304 [Pseudomonas syringae pv. actinidiae ICMP 19098]EPN18107.1 hypothetical protein A248_14917 [Pseudomonas syringae pv. actinidiae ICMP 19100]EPN25671.1 hypothetical protein A247_15237 [Pseudomonas syringae pv. actinidiae ICMP 19099]EPN47299.1 hypothetical protein A244_20981 [Pseudomonas syringae pv. actinidiae ICMP 18807]KTC48306.1 hypothetical protein AO250_12195 [Pseudomonas syringae pv. actinidiae ICMP 19
MNRENQTVDHDRNFELIFGAAQKILEAAKANQDASIKTAESLRALEKSFGERLSTLERTVTESINSSVDRTSTKAAGLLREKFDEADAAAMRAARLYNASAKALDKRSWIYFLAAQLALVACVAGAAYLWLPSFNEVAVCRAELAKPEVRTARPR